MKKKDLKLTEELQEAFKRAHEYSQRNSLSVINTGTLIFYCIQPHIYRAGSSTPVPVPEGAKKLYRVLSDLSSEERLNLEANLKSIMPSGKRKKGDIELNEDEVIPFSIDLETIINCASDVKSEEKKLLYDRRFKKEKDVIIGIDDVINTILMMDDLFNDLDEEVIDLLEGEIEEASEVLMNCGIDIDTMNGATKVKDDEEKFGKEFLETLNRILKNEEEKKASEESAQGEDPDYESMESAGQRDAIDTKKIDPNSETPSLDKYAVDMTKNAKEHQYDPVIGREKEIDQIIEILCCRKKNNAVLTGDPGCGKTAIIESLAMKIVSGDVPMDLRDKRIFSLDLNSLVSGTQYRGQYEQRLQDVIKEVTTCKNIIVFIDELHNLIGNGSSAGSGDGANILKPYLARGEFQCIGSTTTDEYRKFIEKDGALKRRFSPVLVEEPGIEDTIKILQGIAPVYGNFHGTVYSDEVIEKCVKWSGKYINDRYFPDKAISVLDMASSLAKLENSVKANETGLDKLERRLEEIRESKIQAIKASRFEEATKLRDEGNEIKRLLEEEKERLKTAVQRSEVTVSHVSKVISKLSNVPVENIQSSDIDKIRSMRNELTKKIIGQDEAVKEITLALQRNIFGLRDPNKPIASFLFVGATGVGKSLIAKLTAKEFMGSENNLITIACSEYMQDWAESKLLGSAPGYVGYSDSEPRLYVLKRKPYSVILIDEVEKSSSNLYNIWLNMLEEGEVTLSSGEKVSCRNSIIIFTGNVGTKSLELKGNGLGFKTLSQEEKRDRDVNTVMSEVEKEFRPEFLNRISKIVVFNSLTTEDLGKIFYLELGKLQARIQEGQGYSLEVSDDVKNLIVSKCEPKYGARSLQRYITEYIEDNINIAILDQDTEGKKHITLSVKENNIVVNFS